VSAAADAAIKQLVGSGPRADSPPPPPVEFHYTQTDSFVALLRQLGMTLLVSPLGRRLGTDLEPLCDPNVNESR